MADKTGEQLSALVDGECEVSEQEWMLRRLSGDTDLKARWQRYHLISDAVKNNLPAAVDARFADRIGEAIDADPPPVRTPVIKQPGFSWYKPVTGFALAASVAAVAVLGLRLADMDDPALPSDRSGFVANVSNDAAEADLESRLNTYLVNHNEYASVNGVQGVLPYVRIVGIETGR